MGEQKAGDTEAHHKGQRRDGRVYRKKTLAEWWNMGLSFLWSQSQKVV